MRYDLIDGATDFIMIDCKNEETEWKDFEAIRTFLIFLQIFTGSVPVWPSFGFQILKI